MSPIDRIDVTGERPYPVLVGRDVRAQLPATVADLGATTAMLVHQPALAEAAEEVRGALAAAGIDAHRVEIPDAEEGKSLAVAGFCWEVCGRVGLTRSDVVDLARRGSGHRPRGLRRRHLDARRAGGARADDAAGDGRRRGRREDRHQHRGGQEPRRGVPRAVGGARRPRHARHPPARRDRRGQRGDHQGGVHRRPDDPRPRRGRPGRGARPRRRGAPRAGAAGDPGEGRGGGVRPARVAPAGDPQLRPHARATPSSAARSTGGGTGPR